MKTPDQFSRKRHGNGQLLRRHRLWLTWAILLALLVVWPASAADMMAARRKALTTIHATELQAYVDTLADDRYEGREAAMPGGRAAGDYLRDQLAELGVDPAGIDGGYFQPFGRGYRNLLARIEGRDPEKRREVIVVGAHYDHVGYGNHRNSNGPVGYIHNGADDNASGVAGVLEVAEAFASLPEPPRRTVLFALWDGEEEGMLGSYHFVNAPTVPLEQIRAAVNVDMIGRMRIRRLHVYGTRSGYGLRRLASECNDGLELELVFPWRMKAESDHYPFFQHDIPVLMLHTGLHDQYHRPSDDAELINAAGLQSASSMLFNLAFALAEQEDAITFRDDSRYETEAGRKQLEHPLPPRPSRLGVEWESGTGDALVVRTVLPDSAAARVGLKPGDRLIEWEGKPVRNDAAWRQLVLQADRPMTVTIERFESGRHESLEVDLDGEPLRIGISWREDEAEPSTAIVTRVVPDSPAAIAGLKPGDRIYAVAQQRFQDGDELGQMLRQRPFPLPLSVERTGQILPVVLRAL